LDILLISIEILINGLEPSDIIVRVRDDMDGLRLLRFNSGLSIFGNAMVGLVDLIVVISWLNVTCSIYCTLFT